MINILLKIVKLLAYSKFLSSNEAITISVPTLCLRWHVNMSVHSLAFWCIILCGLSMSLIRNNAAYSVCSVWTFFGLFFVENRSQRTANIKLQLSRLQSFGVLFAVEKDLPWSEQPVACPHLSRWLVKLDLATCSEVQWGMTRSCQKINQPDHRQSKEVHVLRFLQI